MNLTDVLNTLGIKEKNLGSSTGLQWGQSQDQGEIASVSPVDGRIMATVFQASADDYDRVVETATQAFLSWRETPAPRRGEIVRQIGLKLREFKDPLGRLVSHEMGKSLQEGWGEVQEMIDISDFALGQSRQLYGFTMASERPQHRLYDQYHPLGPVGVITAFNFPVAPWSWNALVAAVCGDPVIWKPASQTPLTAVAVQNLIGRVLEENNLPEGIFNLVVGPGNVIGRRLLEDARLPLISLTGSTRVGRRAALIVAERLGRIILELGGNNAIILTGTADLKLAAPSIVFGAVGTAGQRCTTTRRLIVHESVYDRVKDMLLRAYQGLRIGDPLDETNHVGPLIDQEAVAAFLAAQERLKAEGGRIIFGGQVLSGPGYESGCYVAPALAEAENSYGVVQEETFAPILYLIRYEGGVENAVALQNGVPQGLSSAIFTTDLREAEYFLSAAGSDCGLANVNLGTSGAEIGGAFGGEKNNRRGTGIRVRRLESVHAPPDQHHQLRDSDAVGPGHKI